MGPFILGAWATAPPAPPPKGRALVDGSLLENGYGKWYIPTGCYLRVGEWVRVCMGNTKNLTVTHLYALLDGTG